jgi:peptide/nickel transport system ATP-binding protein
MTNTVQNPNPAKLLEVRDLKVHMKTEDGTLRAVDGVDFTIGRGKTLGLVGESGCGKSITSKAILGIQPKDFVNSGTIMLHQDGMEPLDLFSLSKQGKEMRAIRGGKIAMIFQEPMAAFSPLYTIGNQMIEMLMAHRTKNKKEAKSIAIEMLQMVGIPDPEQRLNQYPHAFSGGMMQRVMIAMALSCRPDLLIADEPTTALDVTIQAQVLELMKDLQLKLGMAILFITHDLGTVAEVCDDVAVMYLGKIVEKASVEEIFNNPKHPYTKGLIGSIPRIGQKTKRLESIEGTVPIPLDMPPMCGFYERCKDRISGLCDKQLPPEIHYSANHTVRCFLYANPTEESEDRYVTTVD